MRVTIIPQVSARTLTFQVAGTKKPIFVDGGFSLHHSFDPDLSDRIVSSMAIGLLVPLILPHFAAAGEHEIRLESGAWASDVANWSRYLQLPANVRIAGPGGRMMSAAQQHEKPRDPSTDRAALLYGGGKDSAAMLTVMQHVYPRMPVHLLRLHWNRNSSEHGRIFELEVVRKLREVTDFEYFSVETTMHADLVDPKEASRLHLGRYLAGFMGYIGAHNPKFLCHGYDALEFHGTAYRRAHPSVVRHVSEVYRSIGMLTQVRAPSFGLTPLANLELIRCSRPELLSRIYMCESLKARWCYACRKCFTFGLYCLLRNLDIEGYDLSQMFSESNPYIEKLDKAMSAPRFVPTDLGFCQLMAYRTHLHALAGWFPDDSLFSHRAVSGRAARILRMAFDAIRPGAIADLNKAWISAARNEGGDDFSRKLKDLCVASGIQVTDSERINGGIYYEPVLYRCGTDDLTDRTPVAASH